MEIRSFFLVAIDFANLSNLINQISEIFSDSGVKLEYLTEKMKVPALLDLSQFAGLNLGWRGELTVAFRGGGSVFWGEIRLQRHRSKTSAGNFISNEFVLNYDDGRSQISLSELLRVLRSRLSPVMVCGYENGESMRYFNGSEGIQSGIPRGMDVLLLGVEYTALIRKYGYYDGARLISDAVDDDSVLVFGKDGLNASQRLFSAIGSDFFVPEPVRRVAKSGKQSLIPFLFGIFIASRRVNVARLRPRLDWLTLSS